MKQLDKFRFLSTSKGKEKTAEIFFPSEFCIFTASKNDHRRGQFFAGVPSKSFQRNVEKFLPTHHPGQDDNRRQQRRRRRQRRRRQRPRMKTSGQKNEGLFLTRNKIGFFPIKDQRPFFLFQPSVAFASGEFLIRARQRFEPTTFQLLSFGSGHHTNLKAFLSIKLPLYGSDWRTIAAVSGIKLSLDFIRRKSIQLSVQQTNKPRQQGSTIKAMYLFLFW